MSVLSVNAGSDELDSLVKASLSYVYGQNGVVLSAAASQHETQFLKVLRHNGFILSPARRPLYVLHGQQSRLAVPELRQLSFLDTDWAYRLPMPYADAPVDRPPHAVSA
jgi:hypothetical protein